MKLTKQQLKQIIKEEIMNETPLEQAPGVSVKNLKIALNGFTKVRTRLFFEFKRFGYDSSQAGGSFNSTIYKSRRLIRDFNLSPLEDDIIEAVTSGYYAQSAGISER